MTVEFLNESSVELINFTGGDEMVARAAWVSNIGEESKTKDASEIQKLIDYLYKNHHMSPFEHGQFTFYIRTPLFVAREFHRHRTMSYNEVSGRYSEMKPRFYIPPRERNLIQHGKVGAYTFKPGTEEQYTTVVNSLQKSSEAAWNEYMSLKDAGVANEVARMVLPLNLMTEFYATVNPRNLMQFLNLRKEWFAVESHGVPAENQALFEIRNQVADVMQKSFEAKMPLTAHAHARFRNVVVDTEAPVG